MNWPQNLLYDALIRTKHVEHAALIKLKEKYVLASTRGINVQPHQAEAFIDAFENTSVIRKEGIYFQGKNYTCVRADNFSIYAKYMNQGLILVKTMEYLLLATYSEGMYPSVCVEAVEKLGDYFKEKEVKVPHGH
ncbi:profilin-4 isoform X2 [Rhinatrema bivittatum]|uniref:profilin-4 isoform X2 n=1 Tax=Rhinatrema bivittatum TaxID=194408 RepID=UPI001126994E|nr:profilin-4 isoform X2 [Rhinatrema bivittatum]